MAFVKITSQDIRAEAYGQEADLMSQIIGSDRMHKRGQSCPACGGDDRFTYNTKNHSFFCRGLGHGGDWLELLVHIHGDYGTAADIAKQMLGLDENSYDVDELRRLQLERAAKRAKEQDRQELARLENEAILGPLYELTNMIERRHIDSNPCSKELDSARELYSILPKIYSKSKESKEKLVIETSDGSFITANSYQITGRISKLGEPRIRLHYSESECLWIISKQDPIVNAWGIKNLAPLYLKCLSKAEDLGGVKYI